MIGETLERQRLENARVVPDTTFKALSGTFFPRDPVGRIGRRGVVLGVLFVVLAATASLARQGGPGALNSVWAEDGLTFYQATFHQDAVRALFTPNNGYLQLLPRIVIPVVALFPISWAAGLMAVVGALASSACALLVYHASAALVLVNRAANRLFAAICAAFSLGFFCLATMQGGAYNDRYAVPPALLLITALAVVSSPAAQHFDDPRPSVTRACVPLAVLCVLLGANFVANYYGGSATRASQPSWSSQLADGRAECRMSGTTRVRLQTAPGGGWSVTVPCSRLLG